MTKATVSDLRSKSIGVVAPSTPNAAGLLITPGEYYGKATKCLDSDCQQLTFNSARTASFYYVIPNFNCGTMGSGSKYLPTDANGVVKTYTWAGLNGICLNQILDPLDCDYATNQAACLTERTRVANILYSCAQTGNQLVNGNAYAWLLSNKVLVRYSNGTNAELPINYQTMPQMIPALCR